MQSIAIVFSRSLKDELEAAIVMIAFIVVAAVFSYVMVGSGFSTTQKSQEVVHSGIMQASSSLALSGDVIVGSAATDSASTVTFYVTNTAGGTPVDLDKTIITYTDNDDFKTFPYNATYGTWTYTPVIKSSSASNLVEEGDTYRIELPIHGSGFAPGQGYAISAEMTNFDTNYTDQAYYTITQDDITAGSVTNSVYATYVFNGNEINSDTVNVTVTEGAYDGSSVESNGDGSIVFEPIPVLRVELSAYPATFNAVGQTIVYEYGIFNGGTVFAESNITITSNKTGTFQINPSLVRNGILTSEPCANEKFTIEVKPPEGATLAFTRTLPPSIKGGEHYTV